MFLANKKSDNQVKTFITYNKGRDWRLLQAPDTDLRGDPVHCLLVSLPAGEGAPCSGGLRCTLNRQMEMVPGLLSQLMNKTQQGRG